MSDFPSGQPTPSFINSWTRYMGGLSARNFSGGIVASAAWPAANQACYIPFKLPWPYVVRRLFWVNGSSVNSNADIGIYTSGGAKLYSSGSTAQSGASVPQYVTPASPLLLLPDLYFLGLSFSGTTNKAFMDTAITAILGRFLGMYQQASALPLPATATFASWNSIGRPLCGITRISSGF